MAAQYNTIWMREHDWVLTRIRTQHLRVRPSRAALMLALTNITTFSVRLASPGIPLKAIRWVDGIYIKSLTVYLLKFSYK